MTNGFPLTDERKALFLTVLEEHGIVVRAARAASPGSLDGAEKTFRDARARDPEFAAAWDAAMETARGNIEYEIYRRGHIGVERPIFGGKYREQIVGTVFEVSDRLLELRARALLPAYRDAGPSGPARGLPLEDATFLGQAVVSVAAQMADLMRQPEPILIEAQTVEVGNER